MFPPPGRKELAAELGDAVVGPSQLPFGPPGRPMKTCSCAVICSNSRLSPSGPLWMCDTLRKPGPPTTFSRGPVRTPAARWQGRSARTVRSQGFWAGWKAQIQLLTRSVWLGARLSAGGSDRVLLFGPGQCSAENIPLH
eukprot:3650552-Amphidinium_carterae.1